MASGQHTVSLEDPGLGANTCMGGTENKPRARVIASPVENGKETMPASESGQESRRNRKTEGVSPAVPRRDGKQVASRPGHRIIR